ncbi:DoxX family protein [Gordonia hankookensis]|uniref:DoxX family protein n=1 Tax=Gordonia hankookensis TaxID=589403 RepID=A0ABR7WIA5_9ACTN|nr:DoxX family protein [Gordonia hankookensis]MBD1322479.1 DoxX family protein [Gordonia hankookensis]NDZ97575.1 DoxX family protein [Streptomyces sp. SID11726]NEB26954.1 DoxX family protein [Streptomyces sp. SID6673]
MSTDVSSRAKALDLGLLTLRTAVGATLFAHGAQKLTGWFGGPGIEATASGMNQMGFKPAKLSAVTAGVSEAAGGLVALGAGTRVASAAGAAAMIAAADVHRPNGFFAQNGGLEYPAILGVASAALALTGPGRYSLDGKMGHRLERDGVGVAALAAATAGAVAVLYRRKKVTAAA